MKGNYMSTEDKHRKKRPLRLPPRARIVFLVSAVLMLIFCIGGGAITHHSNSQNAETIKANIASLSKLETSAPQDSSALQKQMAEEELREFKNGYIACDGIMVDDLAAEQAKILAMDPNSVTSADMVPLYKDSVIVGDSVASACRYWGWLPDTIVLDKIGISVEDAGELIPSALAADPTYFILVFGLNDIGMFREDVEGFIDAYKAAINSILAQKPYAIIYVHGLLPCSEETAKDPIRDYYVYLDVYNAALKEMCAAFQSEGDGVFYFETGFIFEAFPEYYDADGLHALSEFYAYWLSYLADIAGLPEAE